MKIKHFIIWHSLLFSIFRVIWKFTVFDFRDGESKSAQILGSFTGNIILYIILALIILKFILKSKNALHFLLFISGSLFLWGFLIAFIYISFVEIELQEMFANLSMFITVGSFIDSLLSGFCILGLNKLFTDRKND